MTVHKLVKKEKGEISDFIQMKSTKHYRYLGLLY